MTYVLPDAERRGLSFDHQVNVLDGAGSRTHPGSTLISATHMSPGDHSMRTACVCPRAVSMVGGSCMLVNQGKNRAGAEPGRYLLSARACTAVMVLTDLGWVPVAEHVASAHNAQCLPELNPAWFGWRSQRAQS